MYNAALGDHGQMACQHNSGTQLRTRYKFSLCDNKKAFLLKPMVGMPTVGSANDRQSFYLVVETRE